MTTRRVLVGVLVPLVVLLVSGAWYGLKGGEVVYLMSVRGAPIGMLSNVLTALYLVRVVGLLAGGVAAALIGPFVTASIGLLLFAAATLALALDPTTGMTAPVALFGIASFANGLSTGPLWGALASAFARPLQAARDAAFLMTYGALQVGAMLASIVPAAIIGYDDTGFPVLFAISGAIGLVAAVLCAAMAGGHLALPPVPASDTSERFDGRVAGLAVAVGLLSMLPWVGWGIASSHSWTGTWNNWSAVPMWALQAVNPILVVIVVAVAAALSAGAAFARLDLPVLLVPGAACLVAAAGAALGGGAGNVTVWGYFVGVIVLSGVEGLLTPILLSRIVGDVHWRLSALFAGLWLGVGTGLLTLTQRVGEAVAASLGQSPPLLAGAALCALGGLVLLAIAVPHQRLVRMFLDGPPAEPAEPA